MSRPRQKTKVMIIDDSLFMRRALSRILDSDPQIEVAAVASSSRQALDLIDTVKPDVITLDVMMPGEDGLSLLKKIMKKQPRPVLMVSALTTLGADTTFQALQMGALDVVGKPSSAMDMPGLSEELINKVKAIAEVDIGRIKKRERPKTEIAYPDKSTTARPAQIDLVAIGSSTGGPCALETIIAHLPATFSAAMVIVQHMPPGFTATLAKRLNGISSLEIKEAENGDIVRGGRVLVAPSRYQLSFKRQSNTAVIKLSPHPANTLHIPSVDVMMNSAAKIFGSRAMGVILTGMGNDGAKGMLAIKKNGGRTIAEAEDSCVVFGMPKQAIALGAAEKIVPLARIATEIVHTVLAKPEIQSIKKSASRERLQAERGR